MCVILSKHTIGNKCTNNVKVVCNVTFKLHCNVSACVVSGDIRVSSDNIGAADCHCPFEHSLATRVVVSVELEEIGINAFNNKLLRRF
jgi:hypothetical protein